MATKMHLKKAQQDEVGFVLAPKANNGDEFATRSSAFTTTSSQKRSYCNDKHSTEEKSRKRHRSEEEKKHDRKMANRRSAKESRERRRALMKSLKEDNKKLAEEHEDLNHEYERLNKELKFLQEKRRFQIMQEVEKTENIKTVGAFPHTSPQRTSLVGCVLSLHNDSAGACLSSQNMLQQQKSEPELIVGNLAQKTSFPRFGGLSSSSLTVTGHSPHKPGPPVDACNLANQISQELLLL